MAKIKPIRMSRTVNLKPDTHKRLRIAAAIEEKTIQEILDKAVLEYCQKKATH